MKTTLCVLFILSAILTIIIYPSFIMAGRTDEAIEKMEIEKSQNKLHTKENNNYE